jgi:hypothetical protein
VSDSTTPLGERTPDSATATRPLDRTGLPSTFTRLGEPEPFADDAAGVLSDGAATATGGWQHELHPE